ncbi:MAG: aminopeptidase [bacterium]|nr:aminopeptidase [bacterium]
MKDPRFAQLAHTFVHHSTKLQKGEQVLIESASVPHAMLEALIDEVIAVGATPHINFIPADLQRHFLLGGSMEDLERRLKHQAAVDLHRMEQMQAYIGIRGKDNVSELADVPAERVMLYNQLYQTPVHMQQRVKHTKWLVTRWPTPSMAQLADMSTEAFEDFYFSVCLTDYAHMEEAAKPLVKRMASADKVRLTGPDTDLSFSIKNIGAVSCHGLRNIPDGECYSAPVRDSVNGVIHFNTPTVYQGYRMEDVRLVFKDGKVIEATSTDTEALNKILDGHEGNRYLGEFALGFNPNVTKPMCDTLFDEKISGSIHLALGNCYDAAPNGNKATIHWDIVFIQKEGGDIFFDDELIRHNGLFVTEDLLGLNPDGFAKA